MSNLSGDNLVEEAADVGGPYLFILDKGKGVSVEVIGMESREGIETSLGELNFIPIEKKFRLLYPTSDEEINYLYDDNHTEEDIQLLFYNDDGEIMSHLYFSSSVREYLLSE